ncbi:MULTISPECIES: TerD family protein [unclassified Pseudomonas]|uniref:TerD family protein n=1 Tax=unclassified Pseudomonas TaxID=196821 RepID=UPI002AC981A5|nr:MULTISPECIES: TerD family protein [unclassified Pseudomonas]MEB0041301.1 TerD family protein [Pseudomonas sp. MH10]MEB0075826.1 TerD family protein [Pseudomonas sp. MH10out]MEB0091704.1 TerD family protein [Pseudomonas sp. CCI4.2]MEB0102776.1 TerD family protein [Pseudomonas sp. CCI3.2]MEB0123813.1 TerD family protein [Pseudomonas sp. CCI1.2]
MAITLTKNQTISLEKTAGSGLKQVTLGLGWDPVKPTGFFSKLLGAGSQEIDLDASCIVLDGDKKPIDLVWFRALQSNDGSIKHSGDNRTGEGDGDDESIAVDLEKLPATVKYLVFTVNSFTGQNFERIENATCRIVNADNGNELARFNLSDKGQHTGVVMACLTRSASGWDFTTIGEATNGRTADDLVGLAARALRA